MELEKILAMINSIAEQIKAMQAAQTNTASKEEFSKLQTSIDEYKAEMAKYQKAVDDLKAENERFSKGAGKRPLSVGERFAQADEVKKASKAGVPVQFDITSVDGNGNVITPDEQSNRLPMLPAVLNLRKFLTVIPTSDGSVKYVQETGYTSGAAVTGQNAAATASVITFTTKTVALETINTYIPMSKQVYQDGKSLAAYVNNRLLTALDIKENGQIITWLAAEANIQKYNGPTTAPAGSTLLDNLRAGITLSAKAQYRPDLILLSPDDFATIELEKDSQGRYVYEFKADVNGNPVVWRLPVFEDPSVPTGKGYVGSFKMGCTLWDREVKSVQVSSENSDNFIKGMMTVLAEERVILTVERPEAFVEVTFGALA